jgi:excisionase family DNA binding protein
LADFVRIVAVIEGLRQFGKIAPVERRIMITNVVDGAAPINIVPTESDRKMARESQSMVKDCLAESGSCRLRIIVDGVERDVDIPMTAMRVLGEALRQIALGKAPVVMPLDAEVSTQQAADLLNVSRPYLIRLLDSNEIPFRRVGAHRRIRLLDVLTYKRRNDEERMKVLDELAAQAQELNMGY